tara:strand:- start:115 stop:522 length:408 start_codon:yes stop_codon:yes gene_type:complete
MIDFKQLTQDVIDGKEDPLKAYGIIKQLEKELKEASDIVKEAALSEASNYEEKDFVKGDFMFQKKAGRTIYDFSGIHEWKEVDQYKKDLEKKYKGAFSAYKKGSTMIDDETGEVVPVPKVKFTQDVLTVKALVSK